MIFKRKKTRIQSFIFAYNVTSKSASLGHNIFDEISCIWTCFRRFLNLAQSFAYIKSPSNIKGKDVTTMPVGNKDSAFKLLFKNSKK